MVSSHSTSGFSLVQVSALIAVSGIIMVSMLPSKASDAAKEKLTYARMEKIEAAMDTFMRTNLRRPCPADGVYRMNEANFGVEAGTAGACTSTNNYTGAIQIVVGVVPTKTLGLTDEFMLDGYGRRFMYFVDKRATGTSTCTNLQNYGLKGNLQIADDFTSYNSKDRVMWALVSYGKDGYGAFPAEGSTKANRIYNTGVSDENSIYNALDLTGGVAFGAEITDDILNGERLVNAARTTFFDDIVWYNEKTKNTCCVGKACTMGVRIDAASTGSIDSTRGISIAKGDINGDGLQDMVFGSNGYSAGTGRVYVVYGSKTNWPVPVSGYAGLDLGSLNGAQGPTGFTITNNSSIPVFAQAVAVGDVNNDGYDDILIGGGGHATSIYGVTLYFGSSTSPVGNNLNTSALNGTNGLILRHGQTTTTGWGKIVIGDIDGNGYKDIMFHPYAAAATSEVYVIFGRSAANWLSAGTKTLGGACDGVGVVCSIDYTTVNSFNSTSVSTANSGAMRIYTTSTANYPIATSIHAIATGDINRDGYDDIVVSGHTTTANAGRVYIFFGRRRPGQGWLDANSWPNSATKAYLAVDTAANYTTKFTEGPASGQYEGVTISSGVANTTYFGSQIAVANMNNDASNYDDVIIGQPDSAAVESANIFILPGSASMSSQLALPLSLTSANTYLINTSTNRPASSSTTTLNITQFTIPQTIEVGDMNNDGANDLIVSSSSVNPRNVGANTGSTFVLFQPTTGWADENMFGNYFSTASVATPLTAARGFRVDGVITEYLSSPLTGDFNGDKKTDLIMAAPGCYLTCGGTGAKPQTGAYLLWGRTNNVWSSTYEDLSLLNP